MYAKKNYINKKKIKKNRQNTDTHRQTYTKPTRRSTDAGS